MCGGYIYARESRVAAVAVAAIDVLFSSYILYADQVVYVNLLLRIKKKENYSIKNSFFLPNVTCVYMQENNIL